MTRRQWGWVGIATVTVVVVALPTRAPFHSTPFAVSPDSVARFAACMGWSARTAKRLAAVRHYARPVPTTADTLGATNGQWVWVAGHLADPWPVLRHEWTHLGVPDMTHESPEWGRAVRCGALLP